MQLFADALTSSNSVWCHIWGARPRFRGNCPCPNVELRLKTNMSLRVSVTSPLVILERLLITATIYRIRTHAELIFFFVSLIQQPKMSHRRAWWLMRHMVWPLQCNTIHRDIPQHTTPQHGITYTIHPLRLLDNVCASSKIRWRAHDLFPISDNWTFWLEAFWAKVSRIGCASRDESLGAKVFAERWSSNNSWWCQKSKLTYLIRISTVSSFPLSQSTCLMN